MGELLTRSSSMCSTTLRTSRTRLLSCLRAGPAPKQNLRARRMFCWLRFGQRSSDRLVKCLFRFCLCHLEVFNLSRFINEIRCFYPQTAAGSFLSSLAEDSLDL